MLFSSLVNICSFLWSILTVFIFLFLNYLDLDEALDCYKIAMRDPVIQREKSRYFEIASMNFRLGRHQVKFEWKLSISFDD